jgi:hypothetical protein
VAKWHVLSEEHVSFICHRTVWNFRHDSETSTYIARTQFFSAGTKYSGKKMITHNLDNKYGKHKYEHEEMR